MADRQKRMCFELFSPEHVEWDGERQELDIDATVMAGIAPMPIRIQLTGAAAIQLLRSFQRLLDHVDIDAVADTKLRGLQ